MIPEKNHRMPFLHVAIIAVCVFIIIVLLVNAAFFNHENNGTSTGVSSTTAWAMIFLNLVFIIPIGLLLAVSLYEVVKGTKLEDGLRAATLNVRKGALSTTSTGGVRVTKTVTPTSHTTVTEVTPASTSRRPALTPCPPLAPRPPQPKRLPKRRRGYASSS